MLAALLWWLTGCRFGFDWTGDDTTASDGGNPGACVISLSAGTAHTCAVTRDGGVWCWGENAFGQIGDNTVLARSSPTRVFDGAVQVAAGGDHTCVRTAAGEVWCWGLNNRGQLGYGDAVDRPAPMTPIAGLAALEVTAGQRFSCARDATRVWCWGHNWYGQLGDSAAGNSTNRPPNAYTPIEVTNLARPATAISSGEWHACATLDDGSVHCWGYSCCGQLGNSNFTPDSEEPFTTPSTTNLTSATLVSGGGLHSCALTTQRAAWCWGKGIDGALGYGGSAWQWSPIEVGGLAQLVQLESGGTETCAITEAGELYCWGENLEGEVGDGTMTLRLTPQRITAGDGASRVVLGTNHVAAVIGDQVWTWGANASGQLGDGSTTPRSSPGLSLLSCDGL